MRPIVLALCLAMTSRAWAEPVIDCGDARLRHRRHNPVRITSTPPGASVRIQWNMKIAGHEECGTVTTPWEGSLPAGSYNLIVELDGTSDQRGLSLDGRRSKRTTIDVTPRPR